MSSAALRQFEEARKNQLDRNEARRMWAPINQARGDTHGAGARWPFELTQNAHDPGARLGLNGVNIRVLFDGRTVVYEHDGKPFTMQDLAALLSGGSSKEIDSTETTGRFGTGFLVTHVLSLQIDFVGVLEAENGFEEVSIHLDRSGDENRIFANTTECYQAIAEAPKLAGLDDRATARFEFNTDNPDAASIGIATFGKTAPYLYGTCEHLGSLSLRGTGQANSNFKPEAATERWIDGVHVRERLFTVYADDAGSRTFKAVRLRRQAVSLSSLVVLTERLDDGWRLCVPSDDLPKIFCRFPIRGSDFLPMNAIVDGRFDLRQERDRVLMKEEDKTQITEALKLLPALVQLAINERWADAHKLARLGMPERAFGERLEQPLRDWWRDNLSGVAKELAEMPIIQTSAGMLKAVGPTPIASVVMAQFEVGPRQDEIDFARIWQVASQLHDLHPPILEIASDWSAIASQWTELGVKVQRLALREIAERAQHGSTKLDDLKVTVGAMDWLSRFLDLVGQVADQHNCTAILEKLIPNQKKALKSPAALSRDPGLRNELKDIAESVDYDIRDILVLQDLIARSNDPQLLSLTNLFDSLFTESLSEADVLNTCIEKLSSQLPDGKTIPEDDARFGDASFDLLKYLWNTQGVEGSMQAKRCPLIASDGSSVRWSIQRKPMAPVSMWHPAAQQFARLYEPDRILTEDYVSHSVDDPTIVDALVNWDIAFADPLCIDTPRELRDERLKAVAAAGEDCANVTVSGQPMSQIALLPNQLIQRCQASEELARLLLGLVLNHVVVNDPSWQHFKKISGRRDRADVRINIRPALWLSDLKTKAWVPVRGEKDGEEIIQPVIADAGNLRPLLDSTWLVGNDAAVELLSQFFGFSALELRLLSTVLSEADRNQVEHGLARIVQVLGGDPTKYSELIDDLAAQQKREADKQRNRRFGLNVQRAIESYLGIRGLHPELIDCGYDYDLFLTDAPTVDAGTHHLKLADYLLEVKATTTGEVRLTPAQVQKAAENPDRFVLCVVDLRGITSERMEGDWSVSDVEPRSRIVANVGVIARRSHDLVNEAKDCEVGIRNEIALRYGVPVSIWEGGLSLPTWIAELPLQSDSSTAPTLKPASA